MASQGLALARSTGGLEKINGAKKNGRLGLDQELDALGKDPCLHDAIDSHWTPSHPFFASRYSNHTRYHNHR